MAKAKTPKVVKAKVVQAGRKKRMTKRKRVWDLYCVQHNGNLHVASQQFPSAEAARDALDQRDCPGCIVEVNIPPFQY